MEYIIFTNKIITHNGYKMKDKAHKTFVCRVNGYSIYWSDRQARKDAYRFIILKNDRQVYDTADLYGAITHCLEEKEWTSVQRKRFIELAKVHDRESVSDFKKR